MPSQINSVEQREATKKTTASSLSKWLFQSHLTSWRSMFGKSVNLTRKRQQGDLRDLFDSLIKPNIFQLMALDSTDQAPGRQYLSFRSYAFLGF